MKTIPVWLAALALSVCAPVLVQEFHEEFHDCRGRPQRVAIPGKDS